MELDTQQLADFYGVSTARVNQWVREGAPVKIKGSRGIAHIFDTGDFSKWRDSVLASNTERMTLDEARLKKLAAEASISELELAKKKGDVVDLDEIERDLKNKFATLRSSIRSIPERVVLQLIGLKDEVKIKTIILTEIDSTLKRIIDE